MYPKHLLIIKLACVSVVSVFVLMGFSRILKKEYLKGKALCHEKFPHVDLMTCATTDHWTIKLIEKNELKEIHKDCLNKKLIKFNLSNCVCAELRESILKECMSGKQN